MLPFRAALHIAGLLLLIGCSPEQWLVTIYTNAAVPQFGDRLVLEILDDQGALACADCRKQLSAGHPKQWPVSFGIDPRNFGDTQLHVHAQLLRVDHVRPGSPSSGAFLDALGRLPWRSERVVEVGMVLDLECFGLLSDRTPGAFRTCNPATALLEREPELGPAPAEPPHPGSWEVGRDVDCPEQPADAKQESAMICVPGGTFVQGGTRYLGNPNDPGTSMIPNPMSDPIGSEPERLVILSPFLIDKWEFSVQDFVRLQKKFGPLPMPVLQGSTADPLSLCTATGKAADATNTMPLNCVSYETARTLCAVQGKRLPTEAEWEFAAGNRTIETLYPWGGDDDICVRAVVARSSLPGELLEPNRPSALGMNECRWAADSSTLPFGLPAEPMPSDETLLGIRNLGGSLAEWTADGMRAYGVPCWGRDPILRRWARDPVCNLATSFAAEVRGGSWISKTYRATAIQRYGVDKSFSLTMPLSDNYLGLGFRCVKQLAQTMSAQEMGVRR